LGLFARGPDDLRPARPTLRQGLVRHGSPHPESSPVSAERKLPRSTPLETPPLSPWILVNFVCALLLCVVVAFVFTHSSGELTSVRKEIDALTLGQASSQKDIQELMSLVRRRPEGAAAQQPGALGKTVTVFGHPSKGRDEATLTIVEFSNYQCAFCSRHASRTLPQLDQDFFVTGKVKLVFRNFPIGSIHKNAPSAAQAALCAQDQGRFREMHVRLCSNQTRLRPDQLRVHAQAIGLNAEAFEEYTSPGQHRGRLRQDVAEGTEFGVTGTPTFFVGVTSAGRAAIQVTAVIVGAKPYASFKTTLDRLLASR